MYRGGKPLEIINLPKCTVSSAGVSLKVDEWHLLVSQLTNLQRSLQQGDIGALPMNYVFFLDLGHCVVFLPCVISVLSVTLCLHVCTEFTLVHQIPIVKPVQVCSGVTFM